ncbi:hypothetical protein Anapl_02396 [Anas platyrhynchos]|uniref:Uncharacterized protein n=1 Tax=Anas platyrhynchos TaxID=8839 RepID=R0JXV0_ANAPL|nr:hypothetical protein Anapl_02396 [Anas platyrhynchos]
MASYNCGNGPREHTCFGVISAKEGIDLFGRSVQLLLLTEQAQRNRNPQAAEHARHRKNSDSKTKPARGDLRKTEPLLTLSLRGGLMLQQGLDVWIDVICEFKLHHVKVFLQQ